LWNIDDVDRANSLLDMRKSIEEEEYKKSQKKK